MVFVVVLVGLVVWPKLLNDTIIDNNLAWALFSGFLGLADAAGGGGRLGPTSPTLRRGRAARATSLSVWTDGAGRSRPRGGALPIAGRSVRKPYMPLIFAGSQLTVRSTVLRTYRASTGKVDPMNAAIEADAPLNRPPPERASRLV